MLKKVSMIIFVTVFCFMCIFNYSYGVTEPVLIKQLNSALKTIKVWLVKLALPAAAVAIASGVMIRKFSFGNEEKLVIGKKIIINAIVGYAIILGIDLILKTIDVLIG